MTRQQTTVRLFWVFKEFCFKNKIDIFLVLLAAALSTFIYIVSPFSPHLAVDGLGWMGGFDQSSYLKQAHAMANFRLGTDYLYGIGYPLVAVPFIWIGMDGSSAFFVFNLLAFVGVVWALYRFMITLVGRNLAIVSSLALMFATPLITYTAQPWNSSVTLFCAAVILYIASLRGQKLKTWMIVLMAVSAAFAFAARYIDAVWIWLLAALLMWYWPAGWRKIALMTGLTALLCVPVLISHWVTFGSPLKTPYVLHTGINDSISDQDLAAYNLGKVPKTFVGMYISPKLAGDDEVQLGFFAEAFWLLFAFALPLCVKGRPKKEQLLLLGFYAVILVYMLFYLAHRGGGGGSLKYGELHYYKMLWPLMTGFAVIVIVDIFKNLGVKIKD